MELPAECAAAVMAGIQLPAPIVGRPFADVSVTTMKHDITVSPDDIENLPPGALASLNHALRREFEREAPTQRERNRVERALARRFGNVDARAWRIVER